MLAGGVLTLGGAGLAAFSLGDHDGRAVLWIAFAVIGLIGVTSGLRALAQHTRR
jgi:hypothetical protein